jgi:hypothetical protein
MELHSIGNFECSHRSLKIETFPLQSTEVKNPVRASKRTPHFTITKINWLTLFNFNMRFHLRNLKLPVVEATTFCITAVPEIDYCKTWGIDAESSDARHDDKAGCHVGEGCSGSPPSLHDTQEQY